MSENEYQANYELGIQVGTALEQKRIIELLEGFYDGDLWRRTGYETFVGFDVAELIALIKEEQK